MKSVDPVDPAGLADAKRAGDERPDQGTVVSLKVGSDAAVFPHRTVQTSGPRPPNRGASVLDAQRRPGLTPP